jgi:hypothetical protein
MRTLLIIAFCFITMSLVGQDVRQVSFGMTKEQVKEKEIAEKVEESKTAIVYKVTLLKTDYTLCYFFNSNGKLYQAVYNISETYSNPQDYIDHYLSLFAKLTEKYGDADEQKRFVSKAWRDNSEYYGTALMTGNLKYGDRWEKESLMIYTGLMGNNMEVTCGIVYTSKLFFADPEPTDDL